MRCVPRAIVLATTTSITEFASQRFIATTSSLLTPSPTSSTPSKPKVFNSNMPGDGRVKNLTKEQTKEVKEHNREFGKNNEHGQTAKHGKVDKKFWKG